MLSDRITFYMGRKRLLFFNTNNDKYRFGKKYFYFVNNSIRFNNKTVKIKSEC